MALVGLAGLAFGCKPAAEPELVQRPSVRKDPCADRLHDVCGDLLFYYAAHRALPPTVAVLQSAGGGLARPLVCPSSGKPYVYRPKGIVIPGRTGRVVLYDSEPAHAGMRWAVLVTPAAGGAEITARVILVPEKDFAQPE